MPVACRRRASFLGNDVTMIVLMRAAPQRNDYYVGINRAALNHLPSLLKTWLPDGRRRGREWVALNPRRHDARLGSFSVNMQSGRWADFATGDKGGDVISLAAYLFSCRQSEAAQTLAVVLGVRAAA
jgi:hypothetical protein